MENAMACKGGEPPGKIFLIGYRACGKTLVGRMLAANLGWEFLDMDAEISRRAGMSIRAMVARHGWEYFRSRERELLLELSRAPAPGLVVATGGGAVLQQDLWPEIRANSLVVWLSADPATIAARISADQASGEQRPALTERGLLAEISEVLAARTELYRQAAHLQIDTATLEPAAIIARISERWAQERQKYAA
jgi:shikimate kinase